MSGFFLRLPWRMEFWNCIGFYSYKLVAFQTARAVQVRWELVVDIWVVSTRAPCMQDGVGRWLLR